MCSNARLKILRWDCKEGNGLLFPGLETGGAADPQDSHRLPGGGRGPAHRAVGRTSVTPNSSEKFKYTKGGGTLHEKMDRYFSELFSTFKDNEDFPEFLLKHSYFFKGFATMSRKISQILLYSQNYFFHFKEILRSLSQKINAAGP